MIKQTPDAAERARLFERAVSRWENEGGAVVDVGASAPMPSEGSSAPSKGSELEHIKVRLVALENLVTFLLAQLPDPQIGVVREMADYVAANSGAAPYPLTTRAATKMRGLLEGAGHLRSLCTSSGIADGGRADGQQGK